jgi:DNA-binding response OmpR family regulator
MATQAGIMVLGKVGGEFVLLLQHYCLSKNISLTIQPFSFTAIQSIPTAQVTLVFIPISLIAGRANNEKIAFLKQRVTGSSRVLVCVLPDGKSSAENLAMPDWMTKVFNNPLETAMLDDCLNAALANGLERVSSRSKASVSDFCRLTFDVSHNVAQKPSDKTGDELDYPPDCCVGFKLDRRNRCLVINGKLIYLTPKEFELIKLLLTDVNRIFLVDEIVKHLWPENRRATRADLYQYMHLLRKKVEKDYNHPQWLMNVKGCGYKLNLG